MIPLPIVRHRLGAEELIELGRTDHVSKGHVPFLSNRPRISLGRTGVGDATATASDESKVIADALTVDIDLLGGLLLMPIDILAKSESVTFKAVGDLLDHVPSIDVLLAAVLLLGNAVVKFSLPLPPKVQTGFENILNGIADALAASGTPAQNQKAIDQAEAAILAKVSDSDKVKAVLDATGVTGDDLIPVNNLPGVTPANPPPAGVQGPSDLGGMRQIRVMNPVLLMLSKG